MAQEKFIAKLNKPEIKYWQEEVSHCLRRQNTELRRRNNYPFLKLYYEGINRNPGIDPHVSGPGSDHLASIINEFFPNINELISTIMFKNPDFIAEATKPEAEPAQNLMEAALTYGMRKTDALTENRVGLFDKLVAGFSAIEVGHTTERDENTNIPDEKTIESRKPMLEKLKDKARKLRNPKDEEEAEEQFESEVPDKKFAHATNEGTFVRRWNPLNIPLDWKAKRIKDMRYILKRIEMSKAEFDAKYPKFKDKINTGGDVDRFDHTDEHDNQLHSKKVILWEFQIKKRAVGGGNNEYWNLVIHRDFAESEIDYYKRPYVSNDFDIKIGTLHKYGELYPISTAQINKKMQDEMNSYVRHMKEVAERNVPKYEVDQDRVGQGGVEALQSDKVNDVIFKKGPLPVATSLAHTTVAPENKELIAMFDKQTRKGWKVSNAQLQVESGVEFAEELKQQQQSNLVSSIDIQEGMRLDIQAQMEGMKDIIANFWDGEYFFKVTSRAKPIWYTSGNILPNPAAPGTFMVENDLTNVLTGDYYIKVDITSALRPNKDREKQEKISYLTWLTNPANTQLLALASLMVNPEVIKKSSKDFGFNPETVLVSLQVPGQAQQAQGATGNKPQPAQTSQGGVV